MIEVWKAILGFEGSYEVSDMGRVRSLPRLIWRWHKTAGFIAIPYPGVMLRPGLSSSGYYSVSLKGRSYLIHELILKTFCGVPPLGYIARHLDGVKTNSVLSNLEWATERQNCQDKKWHGSHRKLTAADSTDIKRRLRAGESPLLIAERFNVTRRHIYHIKNGVQHCDV